MTLDLILTLMIVGSAAVFLVRKQVKKASAKAGCSCEGCPSEKKASCSQASSGCH